MSPSAAFRWQNNTTGDRNVAVGYLTLDANQQGDRNTAVATKL